MEEPRSVERRLESYMKTQILTLIRIVAMIFVSITTVYPQDAEDMKAYALSDSLIKIVFGPTYDVGGVLDVDHILTMPKEKLQWEGYIFEDPNNQLQHCVICCFGKWDSMDASHRYGSGVTLNDSGGVAIIRDGKIVWHSKRFILRYTDVGSRISGFADLNNDGTTDIICSMCGRYTEALWLVSPTHQGGRLLNAIDDHGNSVIEGGDDTLEIVDSGKNKIKEIQAIPAESENLDKVIYTWQGSTFSELRSKKKKNN
jgi:hypothetical protein